MTYRSASRALILAVALAVGSPSMLAYAQATDSDISVLREEARELYRKGMQRYRAERYAQARASFLAAWSLEQHWSIALSLGDCESKLSRYRDAAEHLEIALREMPTDHPSRSKTEEAFRAAKQQVAEIRFTVDVDGAELFVDGKLVGKSPLSIPVFVDPGQRTVEGRAPNRETSTTTIETRTGGVYPIRFVMTTPPANTVPPEEPKEPEAPAAAKPPRSSPPSETNENSSNARSVVLWTGIGVSAAAAGVGLYYTLKASSASGDADSLQDRIDTELGSNGCGREQLPICDDLRQKLDDRDSAKDTAMASWIVSGVLLGTTIGTYFLWPEDEPASTKRAGGTRWTWSPVVLPEGAAISLQGSLP